MAHHGRAGAGVGVLLPLRRLHPRARSGTQAGHRRRPRPHRHRDGTPRRTRPDHQSYDHGRPGRPPPQPRRLPAPPGQRGPRPGHAVDHDRLLRPAPEADHPAQFPVPQRRLPGTAARARRADPRPPVAAPHPRRRGRGPVGQRPRRLPGVAGPAGPAVLEHHRTRRRMHGRRERPLHTAPGPKRRTGGLRTVPARRGHPPPRQGTDGTGARAHERGRHAAQEHRGGSASRPAHSRQAARHRRRAGPARARAPRLSRPGPREQYTAGV